MIASLMRGRGGRHWLYRKARRQQRAYTGLARPAATAAVALLAVALLAAGLSACASSSSPGSAGTAQPTLNLMLPASVRSAKVLTVLTDPEFAPISYQGSGSCGDIAGSDPDILCAMGKALGVRVQFVPVAFTGLLPGLASGRGDVAGGGITDTTQREQAVMFVDDFSLGELYIVAAGNAAGISSKPLSICGKTVAYTLGAVSATAVPALSRQCVAARKPPVRPVPIAGVQATILAVLSGRAQVTMYDDIGFAALNKADHGRLQAFRINPFPGQYWGFAVSRSDPQLATALLAALRAVVADGQYKAILDRYGVGGDALLDPGIDLQRSRPQG
jgi:polar amino acid transport system substrate-binding protein